MNTNRVCWALSLFILICAVWASNARAETNVFVGAWSKHVVSGSKDLNEQHDLIAIEHNDWFAGRFINSHDRETFALAHKWAWRHGKLEAGVYGGAMVGYRSCYGDNGDSAKTCPMIAPYLTWHTGPVNPQIFVMGEALAVSIRVGF